MKLLVTGAGGQLGSAILALATSQQIPCIGLTRGELDITDVRKVESVLTTIQPDVIIHCAAYTQVDQAEEDEMEAYRVNAAGTRNLCVVAEQLAAVFVYVSTDYVFDGSAKEPIDEWTPPAPLGVYGRSKLAGEQAVQQFHSKFFIVRTSWVFGHRGKNFVKTMLALAEKESPCHVVDDQIGSPTYAPDLAEMLFALIGTKRYGIYHVSNSGSCSWYEFAHEIFMKQGVPELVKPCATIDYPTVASRPAYSVFAHKNLQLNQFPPMRHWREAIHAFLDCEKDKSL
ncbi:dTDP-4-dehydrorhamnose reductase [Bacillus sp. JCM 19047]|uniref:dTDP-4-dehydrorhamnose reductase n=1 Tax=Shouchella miscanthi TaxID=2598861 RepID=A0ABU6NNT5_9BACI|nr:dTDP-4-dehydrorhamnose reductase [Shouchella miscanthi]MED4129369.1 dTDP-4-dehydrorhamnose reductase [Shouchella miscanthi]GAF21885.1 dTDP-4-dehydrorhamnose reductase [Bacillus sp. JCM 19047]